MWVVTREINEYDQDGEYFVTAYKNKPNLQNLRKLLPNETDVTILKLMNGGGRQDVEYEWFNLHEIKNGEQLNI